MMLEVRVPCQAPTLVHFPTGNDGAAKAAPVQNNDFSAASEAVPFRCKLIW
jgi:hypothetical protein